ncbi:MAG TPA: uroporphyrinogen-III synthase, partial [Polyangiaceae bacterium]
GIPFEIVPGISSPVAAAAYAGISLTHRDLSSSATFITGSDREGKEWSPESWKRLATATDTICILMGMKRIESITAALVEGGRKRETPAVVVQWGARPEQRVVIGTLGDIADKVRAAGLTNPAVIIVGEVVSLRGTLSWFEKLPLFGRRVLVPRPTGQAERTAHALRERGAEARVVPVIEICDPSDPKPFESEAERLDQYDWVLFTSANGVERLFAELERSGRDARAFGRAKIGVIGPRTGDALRRFGVRADLVADEHVGEGLGRDLLSSGPIRSALIVRAQVARDALPSLLKEAGVKVTVVAAYETRPAPALATSLTELIETGAVDTALFTSSSTVTTTVDALGARATELLGRLTVASIGPITTRAAEELGVRVDVTATTFTVDGLLDALERHLGSSSVSGRSGT